MKTLAHIAASSSPLAWYLTRDLGLAAYLTLTLTVLLGLTLSVARGNGERAGWHLQELHATLATLTGLLILGHLLTLLLDTYVSFSLMNLLVPLNQPISPLTVDLGVFGMYGMLALLLSSWFRKHLPVVLWRAIHYLSFGAFLCVTLHGWLTGSDSVTPWMPEMYLGCTVAVGALCVARLFPTPQPSKRRSVGVIPRSLIIALAFGAIGMLALFLGNNALAVFQTMLH